MPACDRSSSKASVSFRFATPSLLRTLVSMPHRHPASVTDARDEEMLSTASRIFPVSTVETAVDADPIFKPRPCRRRNEIARFASFDQAVEPAPRRRCGRKTEKTMRSQGRNAASLAAIVTCLALLTCAGNDASAQDAKAEWQKTVAAADTEGELILLSQPNQAARDFLLREWAKAYPKITLSLSVARAGGIYRAGPHRAASGKIPLGRGARRLRPRLCPRS